MESEKNADYIDAMKRYPDEDYKKLLQKLIILS
jgi:hypothetical protein